MNVQNLVYEITYLIAQAKAKEELNSIYGKHAANKEGIKLT